jgi:hypothetical protein
MKSQMRFRIARRFSYTPAGPLASRMSYKVEARVPDGDWYNPIPGAVRIDTLREAFDQIETLASLFNLEAYKVKVEDGG